jgi:hypothetical protein
MPDRLDALFEQMRGVQPPARFSPPDQVRRLGQQRTHRHRLAVGSAVLAVAASTAGVGAVPVLLGDRDPKPRPTVDTYVPTPPASPSPTAPSIAPPVSPPVSPSVSPPPSGIPQGLMIAPTDLGPGNWRPVTGDEMFNNMDRWLWAEMCPAYRSDRFLSLRHRASLQTIAYRSDRNVSTFEIVERYADSWGHANLDDVRAVIALCGNAPPPADTAPNRHTIVASAFAGDESLLVKSEAWSYEDASIAPEPFVMYIAVVRMGDYVATVWSSSSDAAYVRSLAERAAARLR